MGTQGVQQKVAEQDAGVDVDGDPFDVVFLRRDADAGVEQSWTVAERLYLSNYLKSGALGKVSATSASKYKLLEAVIGKGQRLVMGDEIEQIPSLDGRPGYRLTEEGVKNGIVRLTWVTGTFNDRGLAGGPGLPKARPWVPQVSLLRPGC
jgi:hypothetical protein